MSDPRIQILKLQQITVDNGATENEAKIAKEKIGILQTKLTKGITFYELLKLTQDSQKQLDELIYDHAMGRINFEQFKAKAKEILNTVRTGVAEW